MFDKEKALKWLDEKWPKNKRACEICGTSQWSLSSDLITPMIFNAGNLSIGGNSYPQLMVICNNCGNTKYINTVVMGLTEGKEKRNAN